MVLTGNDILIEGTTNITNTGENRNVNNDSHSLSTSSEGKCLNDYIDPIRRITHNWFIPEPTQIMDEVDVLKEENTKLKREL